MPHTLCAWVICLKKQNVKLEISFKLHLILCELFVYFPNSNVEFHRKFTCLRKVEAMIKKTAMAYMPTIAR
jgi:hypothetical protein